MSNFATIVAGVRKACKDTAMDEHRDRLLETKFDPAEIEVGRCSVVKATIETSRAGGHKPRLTLALTKIAEAGYMAGVEELRRGAASGARKVTAY